MVETWAGTHDLVMVDAGDAFSKSPTVAEATRGQQELKAELQVRSLVADGLQAFVPGAGDLALGSDFLGRMIDEHGLPVLAANLVCEGRTFPGTRVVEAAGRRVGLVGLVGAELQDCEVKEPVQALNAGLAALGEVDLTVLVLNAPRRAANEILEAVSGVDFVVTGGSGQTIQQPRRLTGGAWQLAGGSRGKKLGVLSLTWKEGASGWLGDGESEALARRLDRYRTRVDEMADRAANSEEDDARRRAQVQRSHYQEEVRRLEEELAAAVEAAQGTQAHRYEHHLVELDSTISDHPRVAVWMGETKAAVNALASLGSATPSDPGPFVGSQACSGCHGAETRQWEETGHARAWPTLVAEERQGDPDCVSCHATGHWHAEGPSGVPVASSLRGVGCEDCHGPGQDHVRDPVKARLVTVPGEGVCVRCHDGVRDEGRFDFERYLPQVVHGDG